MKLLIREMNLIGYVILARKMTMFLAIFLLKKEISKWFNKLGHVREKITIL